MNRPPISPHAPASAAFPDVLRHYLGDLVYGANDGIVTSLAVVSGVAGAQLPASVVLILGAVNLLADGFSMGASNFLAIRSASAAEGRFRGFREPLVHAAVTFASFVGVGSVPLVGYLLFPPGLAALAVSGAASAAALFAVGSLRSWVSPIGWLRGGLEILWVGSTAAVVAFAAGSFLARWAR